MNHRQSTRRAVALWSSAAVVIASVGIGSAMRISSVSAAPAGGGSATANCGNCNGNSGNGGGNGAGTGAPGQALTLTGSASGQLGPGTNALLTVQITNSNGQDAIVTGLVARTTSVTPDRRDPSKVACDFRWITFDDFTGTPTFRVAARKTAPLAIPVRFTNLPGTNQDNCKGVTYSFTFSATARQA